MISFADYTFQDHKAAFVCSHVCEGFPVLIFVHDADGDIQFMCGKEGHRYDEVRVIGLSHLLEHIQSIGDMPTVDRGFFAERSEAGAPWVVHVIAE